MFGDQLTKWFMSKHLLLSALIVCKDCCYQLYDNTPTSIVIVQIKTLATDARNINNTTILSTICTDFLNVRPLNIVCMQDSQCLPPLYPHAHSPWSRATNKTYEKAQASLNPPCLYKNSLDFGKFFNFNKSKIWIWCFKNSRNKIPN